MKRRNFLALILTSLLLGACSPSGSGGGHGNPPAPRNAKPGAGPIVAFGDSLTSGLPTETPYTDFLSKTWGVTVINKGEMGITSRDALASLQSVVELHPHLVIITIGGNDSLINTPLRVQESLDNLSTIIKTLQDDGALVVFAGINPPITELEPRLKQLPPEEFAKFGFQRFGMMSSQARQDGALVIDDIMSGLWTDQRYKADIVHPNSAGNEIIAGRLVQLLKDYYP